MQACGRLCSLQPAAACGTLAAGEALATGATLEACGGCFNLEMQADGNLVVYHNDGSGSLWASNTSAVSGSAYLALLPDGNLVMYSNGSAMWTTNTGGH